MTEHPCARTGRCRIHQTPETVYDIRCGHSTAFPVFKGGVVVKKYIGPQPKGELKSVRALFPSPSQRRNEFQLIVGFYQCIVELMCSPDDCLIFCESRIQCSKTGLFVIMKIAVRRMTLSASRQQYRQHNTETLIKKIPIVSSVFNTNHSMKRLFL